MKISLMAALFVMATGFPLLASANTGTDCSKVVSKCNKKLSVLQDALESTQEGSQAEDALLRVIEDRQLKCVQDIQDACS